MAEIKALTRFKVPLGSQEIELQQIDHAEGGMSLLRIRIREGKRFTIFDIDPATAQQWAGAMQDWAKPSKSMASKPATPVEMVDLAFDVSGNALPANHPFTLWDALSGFAPALADAERAGILPMRLPEHTADMLPRRAKLTLRIPAALAEELTVALSGVQLDLGSGLLQLGMGRPRAITAYPTIHAHHVASDEDEPAFMEGVRAQLDEMRIACNLICGMRRRIGDETQSIQGYSLVIHDLKADASLKLQYRGLGESRQYGCGIFVPYKVISGLDDD